jgi:hypothetical protein
MKVILVKILSYDARRGGPISSDFMFRKLCAKFVKACQVS